MGLCEGVYWGVREVRMFVELEVGGGVGLRCSYSYGFSRFYG